MKKIKVLMVDDNVNLVGMVKEYFKNHDVISIDYTANDGLEGMKVIEEKKDEIDAVILDLIMPNKDGMYVLETMKSRKISLPVIVATSYNASDVIR